MGLEDQRRRSLQGVCGSRRVTQNAAEPDHFGDQDLSLIYIAKRLEGSARAWKSC